MKFYGVLTILSLLALCTTAHSQFVYKIKADSLLVTNDSCNAELNLENHTRNINGFLYNKGNGRTEFRRGLIKQNDSLYIVGSDTLKLNKYFFQNGLTTTGNTVEWGSDTTNYGNWPSSIGRPTVMFQAGYPFQWITWGTQFHVTNYPSTPFTSNIGPLSPYIPVKISHNTQGFLYLENNFTNAGTYWNYPTFGILFGNRDTNAQKFNYFNQPITGGFVLQGLGPGGGATKDIPSFQFDLAGDTISGRAVTIMGTGTTKYGVYKLPTLLASYRLSIGGGSVPFWEGAYYPYTRFYANAASQPFVWKNLPWNTQTATTDTVLSIDYDGNVRQRQLPQVLTGSATLDFASTAAGTSSDLTVTITGATDGDIVSIGVPNSTVSANSSFTAWVSGSDTVTIRFNNYSSASIDPGAALFKVKVFK